MRTILAKQVAERWGVSPSVIWKWCSTGKLPHTRVGKSILINLDDVEAIEKRGGIEWTERKPRFTPIRRHHAHL